MSLFVRTGNLNFFIQGRENFPGKKHLIYTDTEMTKSNRDDIVAELFLNFAKVLKKINMYDLYFVGKCIAELAVIPLKPLLTKISTSFFTDIKNLYLGKSNWKKHLLVLPVFCLFYVLNEENVYISRSNGELDMSDFIKNLAALKSPDMGPKLLKAWDFFNHLSPDQLNKIVDMLPNVSTTQNSSVVPLSESYLSEETNESPLIQHYTQKEILVWQDIYQQTTHQRYPNITTSLQEGSNYAIQSIEPYLKSNEKVRNLFNTLMSIPVGALYLFLQQNTTNATDFSDNVQISNFPIDFLPAGKLTEFNEVTGADLLLIENTPNYAHTVTEYKKVLNGEITHKQYVVSLFQEMFRHVNSVQLTNSDVEITCKAAILQHSFAIQKLNVYNLVQPICAELMKYNQLSLDKVEKIIKTYRVEGRIHGTHDYMLKSNVPQLLTDIQPYLYDANFTNFVDKFQSDSKELQITDLKNLLQMQMPATDQNSWFPIWQGKSLDKKEQAFKENLELHKAFQKYKIWVVKKYHKDLEISEICQMTEQQKKSFNEFLLLEHKDVVSKWSLNWFADSETNIQNGLEVMYQFNSLETQIIIIDALFKQLGSQFSDFILSFDEDGRRAVNNLIKKGATIKTIVTDVSQNQASIINYLKMAQLLVSPTAANAALTAVGVISDKLFLSEKKDKIRITGYEMNYQNNEAQFKFHFDIFTDNGVLKIIALKLLESSWPQQTVSSTWNWLSNLIGFGGAAATGVGGIGMAVKTGWKFFSAENPKNQIDLNTIANLPQSRIQSLQDSMLKKGLFSFVSTIVFYWATSIITNGNAPSLINAPAYWQNQATDYGTNWIMEEQAGSHAFPWFTLVVTMKMFLTMRAFSSFLFSRLFGQNSLLPRRGLNQLLSKENELAYSLLYVIWYRSIDLRSQFYNFDSRTSDATKTFVSIINFNILNMCPLECRDNPFNDTEWLNLTGEYTNDLVMAIAANYNPLYVNIMASCGMYLTHELLDGPQIRKFPVYTPNHELILMPHNKREITCSNLLTSKQFPYMNFISYKKFTATTSPTLGFLKTELNGVNSDHPYVAFFFEENNVIDKSFSLKDFVHPSYELCCVVLENKTELTGKVFSKFNDSWFLSEKQNVTKLDNVDRTFKLMTLKVSVMLFQKKYLTPAPKKPFSQEFSSIVNKFTSNGYEIIPWIFKPHKNNHTSCIFEALCALYLHIFIHPAEKHQKLFEELLNECKTLFEVTSLVEIPQDMEHMEHGLKDKPYYIDDLSIKIALTSKKTLVTIFKIAFSNLLSDNPSIPDPVFIDIDDSLTTQSEFAIGIIPQMLNVNPISPFPHYLPLIAKQFKVESFTKFTLKQTTDLHADDSYDGVFFHM